MNFVENWTEKDQLAPFYAGERSLLTLVIDRTWVSLNLAGAFGY
jgi:hypothetical protein